MTSIRTQARLLNDFATIQEYWRDPRPFEAEREVHRQQCHAAIDEGIRKARERAGRKWDE